MDENKAELVEKYLNGKLENLTGNDTFTFSCNICGQCCRNRNDILLNPFDIYRISKHLGMEPVDFISKYCDTYIGDTSKIPLVSIKFKQVQSVGNSYTVCPFLRIKEGLGRCTIHNAKPFVCAAYPLGRMLTYVDGKLQAVYFKQETRCGGEIVEHTVNDWLNKFNIKESEQISIMFTEFITNIRNLINIEKFLDHKKISDKVKNLFFNSIFNKLYQDIDLNSNLKGSLETNIKQLNTQIRMLVQVLYSENIDVRGKDSK